MWTYIYEIEKNGYQVFLSCGISVLGNKAMGKYKTEFGRSYGI